MQHATFTVEPEEGEVGVTAGRVLDALKDWGDSPIPEGKIEIFEEFTSKEALQIFWRQFAYGSGPYRFGVNMDKYLQYGGEKKKIPLKSMPKLRDLVPSDFYYRQGPESLCLIKYSAAGAVYKVDMDTNS